jgi:uncharacterized YigZ family protein
LETIDQFETISRRVRVEISKIKGSKFIGDVFPAPTEDDAKSHLASVVDTFPDATHHCYAFSVLSGTLERSSDDGEPSGTAGLPILRQINSSELRNVLVVVTRYYGGTKLGTGGLIRAYGDAAKAALAKGDRITRVIEVEVEVFFDYDDTSRAMRAIEQFSARVISSKYTAQTNMVLAIRASHADAFESAFVDAVAGRGSVLRI